MRAFLAIAVVICSTGAGLTANPAHAQTFGSNYVEYRYGAAFAEPGTGGNIAKNVLNFTHASRDSWGANFLSVDVLWSDGGDPAIGGGGAREVYGIYRRNLSYSMFFNPIGGHGVLEDFGLEVGGDANSKNTLFGPEKRLIVGGVFIAWAVPRGFFKTAFYGCHEWNRNGIARVSVNYETTFCMEAAWGYPVHLAGLPLAFNGFLSAVAPKGKNGFGVETRTEVLTRSELALDVGELVSGQKGRFEIGLSFEYWLNKFGYDHRAVPWSFARTPMVVTRVRF